MGDNSDDGKRMTEGKCLRIDRKLLPTKAAAFAYSGTNEVFFMFIGMYIREIGLSPTESGIIGASMPAITSITTPFFGAMADKYRRHKVMTILMCFVASSVFMSLLLVPKHAVNNDLFTSNQSALENDPTKESNFNNYSRDESDFSEMNFWNASSNDGEIQKTGNRTDTDERVQQFSLTFWLFIVVYIIGAIFYQPIRSLLYSMTYSILGDNWQLWGRQRLWGSVSVIIIGTITTCIHIQPLSDTVTERSYGFYFYVFAATTTLLALCVYKYELSDCNRTSSDIFKGSCRQFTKFGTLSLFFNATVYGFSTGSVDKFLFWHLLQNADPEYKDINHQLLLGIYVIVDGICQIPMFYLSGNIISRIGHIPAIGISFATYAVRFLSYGFIRNPWFVLIVCPLNVPSYVLYLAAVSSYAHLVSPPGLESMTQCLAMSFIGIGFGIGNLATGVLIDVIGGAWMYWIYSAVLCEQLDGDINENNPIQEEP